MIKLTWPRAFVLVAFTALSVVLFLWARDLGARRENAGVTRGPAGGTPAFRVPIRGAAAAKLLGRSRQEVRAQLGTPAEVVSSADRFDVGVPMRFFYEGDRATSLIVAVKDASRNELALRRWLGIGPGGLVSLDGRRLRAGWLPEDGPDSFSVALESEAMHGEDAPVDNEPRIRRRQEQGPVTTRPRASGSLVRLAGELVRTFPAVPDALRSRCVQSSKDAVTQLACRDAVDALVDYQLADDGSWSTLTILGPRGTDEKEACRQWLERNVPDAVPIGQRQRDDELQVYFARGPTRYLVSYLTLPPPGAGASCSLMACLEDGHGNGSACRPR